MILKSILVVFALFYDQYSIININNNNTIIAID